MTGPSRKRPGDESPIKSSLKPEVEAIHTPATERPILEAVPPMTIEPTSPAVPAAPTSSAVITPVPVSATAEVDQKKAVTFGLSTLLKKQAETAVLRTMGYPGGYRSMAALVDGALRREIERLANEYNDGVPFPANDGEFRQGRPLGS